MEFQDIGVIHTPFTEPRGTPIQGALVPDYSGEDIVDERWTEGLADIEGFSHLILLYRFHRMRPLEGLRVKPYMDDHEHGIFAVRSPQRPNPIGLSVVRLLARRGNRLEVSGVDMLDGTPLLDIKPYFQACDAVVDARSGWAEEGLLRPDLHRADDRFGY